MDWAAVWEKIVAFVVPILLVLVVPYVVALIRQKIGEVKDDRLRQLLLDIVSAVEKMIPKTPENRAAENAAKLALAKKLAPAGTPDYKIEAAVATLKGVFE